MGRGIVKLKHEDKDWYLEWSTVVDSPVTFGMSENELWEHVKEEYGMQGVRELQSRLDRIGAGEGTTFLDSDLASLWKYNRAGVNETRCTREQIISMYCLQEGDIVGDEYKEDEDA